MTFVCAIDEAGRGPVIGPLVLAGVVLLKSDVKKLEERKVTDSKLLSPKQREGLFDQITSLVTAYHIVIVNPPEIDAAVEGKDGLNLNWLEAIKAAEIVNTLMKNRSGKVIIDCPSTNIPAYTAYVKKHITCPNITYLVEHKADSTYVACGAASILAKVTRDRLIEEIKKKYGINFGSGYPADPFTQKFLEKHWNTYATHGIFRTSWASWKRLKATKAQRGLFEY